MGSHLFSRRILLAVSLGIAILLFAFISVAPTGLLHVAASDTNDLLRSLATQDADGDGLFDWEETLYGTDPNNPHSVREEISDREAAAQGLVSKTEPTDTGDSLEEDIPVPAPDKNSLTEQFARQIFETYTAEAGDAPLSDAQKERMVAEVVKLFKDASADLFTSHYSQSSLLVDPSASVETYAYAVEIIFSRSSGIEGEKDPLVLIQKAVEEDDMDAFVSLDQIARHYTDTAARLVDTPVPPVLAETHLALVRAFDVSGLAGLAIANVDADPLVSLAAVSVFDTAPKEAFSSIEKIVSVLITTYGTPSLPTMPGYALRSLVLASQEAL